MCTEVDRAPFEVRHPELVYVDLLSPYRTRVDGGVLSVPDNEPIGFTTTHDS